MRPMNTAPNGFWTPNGFNPVMSGMAPDRVPVTVRLRTNHQTYPSGSPNNPGYAYGTFIPLRDCGSWFARFQFPYTVPVPATRSNTIPIVWKNDTQWINPNRSMRMKGLTTVVPGIDTSQIDAIQAYLGHAQG